MKELVRCARALVGADERRDYSFAIDSGRIVDAGDFSAVRVRHPDLAVRAFPNDRIVTGGFVNGHSHAYQILLRGWADDMPFEQWRSEALYRVIPRLRAEDVYWVFVAAFSEMLAAGITTVAEFFYLNGEGNEPAEAVLRAAEHVGIRLVLARAWMDAPHAPEAFREPVEVAEERTRELRAGHPEATICIAPHSLHAASEKMLRAAGAFAGLEGCDLHVHLAERSNAKNQTLDLDRLGALTKRTVAVHAIHVSEEEKSLLAQRGVRVVHCPTTSLYLGDGIADVIGLRERGVRIGLGTDANVAPSIFNEMRAASYLQKVVRLDGSALGASAAFAMGTAEGAAALGVPSAGIRAGDPADFLVVGASDVDPWSPASRALVYRAEASWVQAAYVAGRRVYTGERSPLWSEAKLRLGEISISLDLP